MRYVDLPLLLTVVVAAAALSLVVALPGLRRRDLGAAGTASARALLVGAVLVVLAVTLAGHAWSSSRSANLVPGEGIRAALANVNESLGMLNLLGNVALFVPLGALGLLGLRWSVARAAFVCLLLSVTIEAVQYALGRAADVDDVLLNGAGGLLGALAGSALRAGARPVAERARRTRD